MSKQRLIQRLQWYYPLERVHAFITFPALIILVVSFNPFRTVFAATYGLLVCIVILWLGQHYWKIKLYRLKGMPVDQQKHLRIFLAGQRISRLLLLIMPLIIILQYLLSSPHEFLSLLLITFGANIFAALEYINYYHRQLMLDTLQDWNYVLRYKRLKIASLKKDLLEKQL